MTGLKPFAGTFIYKGVQVNCIDPSRRLGGDLFYFQSPLTNKIVWTPRLTKPANLLRRLFSHASHCIRQVSRCMDV
jgi:hypothetical protein